MKQLSCFSVVAGLVLLLLPGACSKSPSAPSNSFTSPLPSNPSNGSSYGYGVQPVTLTITNAVRTGPAVATYGVEVSSDSGFGSMVFTRDNIAETPGPTTSVVIDRLDGGRTYYWRSKTMVDGVVGEPSPVQSFVVRAQIFTGVPQTISPVQGGTAFGARPVFTVANIARTPSAGALTYEFQVSTTANFANVLDGANVAEQNGSTSWTPFRDLPEGTLFWRARALDPSNNETSGFSSAPSFTLRPFDLSIATILNSPPDLGSWPQTATITLLDIRPDGIHVDFTKKDGPGRWGDFVPPGFDGPIQYTLGMVLNIEGRWYASAVIELWHELDASGGPPQDYRANWFYDPARWAPMTFHQPEVGETIGFFVVAGDARGDHRTLDSPRERSNVVFVPMPDSRGSRHTF